MSIHSNSVKRVTTHVLQEMKLRDEKISMLTGYDFSMAKIIDGAIETFDDLIAKVNKRDVENRKAHLKGVREELEKKSKSLVDQLNKLG